MKIKRKPAYLTFTVLFFVLAALSGLFVRKEVALLIKDIDFGSFIFWKKNSSPVLPAVESSVSPSLTPSSAPDEWMLACEPALQKNYELFGTLKSDLLQIELALSLFYEKNKKYPAILSELEPKYIKELPKGDSINYTPETGAKDYKATFYIYEKGADEAHKTSMKFVTSKITVEEIFRDMPFCIPEPDDLRGIVRGFSEALLSGDTVKALDFVLQTEKKKAASKILFLGEGGMKNLGEHLKTTRELKDLSVSYAEYYISESVGGEIIKGMISFVKDEKGVWRVGQF